MTTINKSLNLIAAIIMVICLFSITSFSQTNDTLLTGRLSLNKLPGSVPEFIKQHYTGYTMRKAAYDPLCSGGNSVDVSISKKGSPSYSLIFLLDGTFVQQEEDIMFLQAPPKIGETIAIKYKAYKHSKQIERLKLADNSIQYLVDISKGKISKEVVLSAEGIVVCEN